MMERISITVSTQVHISLEEAWELWNDPFYMLHWDNASDDWHTIYAENDLRVGGRFLARMAARDGSAQFDFSGVYTLIKVFEQLVVVLEDGRNMEVLFSFENGVTTITEIFDAENMHPVEMQKSGWQSILDNFKKYAENKERLEKLHFEIEIDAPCDKVFSLMLDREVWAEWTVSFSPSSSFEGSWEKGSKIVFLGTDQEGNSGGMLSRIRENIPNKFISIEHVGMIFKGEEITTGAEIEEWVGALENYSFADVSGKTILSIDMDISKQHSEFMSKAWTSALEALKVICER